MAETPRGNGADGGGNGSDASASAFRVERKQGIAILLFDVPGEPVNTLKDNFADEVRTILEELESEREVRAIVIASAKKDNFIAGADISMLKDATTAFVAEQLSRSGQDTMNVIEDLTKPVVAAIHGACLGGGLELALACHMRIATDHKKTKLGLPEVQLGVLPGAGGTQRLPALIGLQNALDLLLTGKQVDARKARKLGLVDEVVPAPILLDVAVRRATELAESRKGERRREERKPWYSRERLQEFALAENPLGRKFVFDQAAKQVQQKTHGNYPAPKRILEVVRIGLERGRSTGLAAEAKAFGELVVTPEASELMNIFFATQALKKDTGVDDESVEPRKLTKVGVLGAGLMGAGIAYVTADLAGLLVRMKDRDDKGVLAGLSYIKDLVNERLTRKRITRMEAEELMLQVTGTTDYTGFENAEVVIEAVFEDLALKQRIVKEVEEHGPKDVVFASNTSSLPIGKIAEASAHPETVIGMHYFSPVHKMPLLEIIVTDKTAPWVTATCVELGKKQGKTVIVVRDGAGFYTTRVLMPYMNEAFHMLGEGIPIEVIDSALVDFGFPVGPIKLTDEVGIDVGDKVGKVLVGAFGDRLSPPPGISKLLEDKRYGRKNKRGFYLYEGKKKGVDPTVYDVLGVQPATRTASSSDDIAWRCTLQLVNEAVRCYEEGILRSPRDGDIGAVFGIGFPPFRGGPFRLVDALSAKEVVQRLNTYRERFGPRFEPAALLTEMARTGAKFYESDAATSGEPTKSPGTQRTGEPLRS